MSVLALGLMLCGECSVRAARPDLPAREITALVQPERGLIEWHYDGRKLLVYAFATNQFKPYVRELRSLRGENVLRDAPADHLHHHGLMYAVRVNGINFWEERDQPGHQRHVKLLADATGRSAAGLPQASFTELIHWVRHDEPAPSDRTPPSLPLLIERRTLTLTVDQEMEEVALAWHAEFEAGSSTNLANVANHITVHGSEYNGLGLRLPAAWDHVALHANSENAPYPDGGKPGAVPARWATVSHTDGARTTQVALFARPGRPGLAGAAATGTAATGNSHFFAMTEPFTYLSATQGLDKAPLKYRTGARFSLDHLVLVHPAARTPAQWEQRYRSWAGGLESNAK